MPLFESLAYATINESIIDQRQTNLKELMACRHMAIDFYELNQFEKGEYFKDWGFKDKNDLPSTVFGLTKSVVNRTSMVYKKPAQRMLINDNNQQIDNDPYAQFFTDNPQFHTALKFQERYKNLLSNSVGRLDYNPDQDRWYYYIENEYIPEFAPDNALYPIGYHFPIKKNENVNSDKTCWLYISQDEMFYHEGEPSKPIPLSGFSDIEQPFEFMPVIDYSDFPVTSYWGLGMRDIVEENRQFLIALMNMSYSHSFQSFDQVVASDLDTENLRKDEYGRPILEIGVNKILQLGADGSASLLGFDFKGVESIEYLLGRLNMHLSNYGMSAQLKEDGNPMSGIALKIKNMTLLEAREQAINDIYRQKEQELYNVIRGMSEYYELGLGLPKDAMLKVDFVDPSFPVNPDEEMAQWDWKFNHGLATPVDYMIEKNPDLSKEEAETKIQENKKFNNQVQSRALGVFEPFIANGNGTQTAADAATFGEQE